MRFGEALAAFIRWVCRDLRYHRHYPATVELQRGDGSVDVTPDDDEIRGLGLTNVRAQPGLPGTEVRATRGARCLVGFRGGDPRRPYISAWETGGLELISIDGGTGGVSGIGDVLEVALPPVLTVSGLLNGVTTPPPPAVPIPIVNLPFSGTATVPPGSVTAIAQTGNPKLLV
jgi:hypothetical protein